MVHGSECGGPTIRNGDQMSSPWRFPRCGRRDWLVPPEGPLLTPRLEVGSGSPRRQRAPRREVPPHGRRAAGRSGYLGVQRVPRLRRRLDRAVAVSVVRVGRLFQRLAESTRPGALRGDRPSRCVPAPCRSRRWLVLRPSVCGRVTQRRPALELISAHVRLDHAVEGASQTGRCVTVTVRSAVLVRGAEIARQ